MNNLLTKLRYVPKRFGLVAAVMVAGATAAISFAWGPSRDTFTVENPAPYVTFNSITNNPVDGDERNFSRAKDTGSTSSSAWSDSVAVTPGKEYVVRMVVHNNAADNLKLKALNTRASASVPTTTGKSVTVSNFVSADNAKPGKVWDDVTFTGKQDFNLAYVPGSARIYNNGYAAGGSGKALPDSIVTSAGALLGYEKAGDGIIPGCFKYLSYVEYKVKPQFAATPSFEVAKTVRKSGTTTWGETVAVAPGDSVQYRIKYSNTSAVQQDNVVVKDTLPAGVGYVTGTTKLYNNLFPSGKVMSDNITGAGINIGHHAGGSASFVVFDAKVAANDALPVCGLNTLNNIAKAVTDYGTKQDDANVTVTKVCDKPKTDFNMDKQVRKHSDAVDGGWVDNYKAEPNEVVDFIIRYKNTGEVVQKNVNVKDTLPAGIVYVAGSTLLGNSKQPNGASVADGVVAGGINIGNYAPGESAWVRFKARVVTNVHLPECGPNTLKNVGFVKTDAGTKNDDATVTVTKVCDNPSAVCKSLTANTISRTEFSFDGEATVENGATVSKYTFVVKNSAGDTVKTVTVNTTALKANSGKVTLTDVGVYTVQLSVTTSVGVKDGPNCKTTVEVKPEVEDKDISVCRLSDKKMIQIKESVYNQNPSLYSKNPSDCDAPTELPSTGPGTIVGGLFGSSALGLGISSYVRSRGAVRSLLNR